MSEEPSSEINKTVDLQKPIVSLDMDDTVLSWDLDSFELELQVALFDGAREFIEAQRALSRACIIATAATESAALSVLARVGVSDKLPNGEDDIFAYDKLATRFRPGYGYKSYHVEPVHGFPIDSESLSSDMNGARPFVSRASGGAWKDFGLLRRHLAGHEGDRLRLVHISDRLDLFNMPTDPETVMVCVDENGQWLGTLHVRSVLDHLFRDAKVLPAGVFDTVFADGSPCGTISVHSHHAKRSISYARVATCLMGEDIFTLARGETGERVIFEI